MEKLTRWMVKRWMPDYYLAHKPRKRLTNGRFGKVDGIPDLGQPGGVENGK